MKTAKFTPPTTEPPKRFLDPFAEGRDYANQWDWDALKSKPASQPVSEPNDRAENAAQPEG